MHMLINSHALRRGAMTLEEKLRYGMIGLPGASVVLSALGVRIAPLDVDGGTGC